METILKAIEEKRAVVDQTADYIWENPEMAFTEYKSAAWYCDVLRKEGFTVEENLGGIQTAFSGRFGSGKPVIGILGEFDALSGLNQVAGAAEQLSAGGEAGHGCGHNLLGAASLGAAIGIKAWLEETGNPGTVIFYGCPGEEGGSGKAFMARDGVFDELDAAITNHPNDTTKIPNRSWLANYQILYKFDGKASHAGGSPHKGRSALDAVELMNVGVQFLREHIPTSCRVHYAITDTGGFSPNVVQPHAEVLYLIRGVSNKIVAELYDRVNDIAKGAALMTGTTESHQFIKACSNVIPNDALQRALQEKAEAIPQPPISDEDMAYGKAVAATIPDGDVENPWATTVIPYEAESQSYGSTDVGDVSWVCPTAQVFTATCVLHTPGHSWQMTAQGKTQRAKDMTIYAAQIMAAGAVELMTNPELLAAAKAEHAKRVGPEGYIPPIPKDVQPLAMNNFKK